MTPYASLHANLQANSPTTLPATSRETLDFDLTRDLACSSACGNVLLDAACKPNSGLLLKPCVYPRWKLRWQPRLQLISQVATLNGTQYPAL